jgi:hypothetical protein
MRKVWNNENYTKPTRITYVLFQWENLNYARSSGAHPGTKPNLTEQMALRIHLYVYWEKKVVENASTRCSNIFVVLMFNQYSPYILCRHLYQRTHNIFTHVNETSVCAVSCVRASERQEVNGGTSIRVAGCHGNTKYWISVDRIKM